MRQGLTRRRTPLTTGAALVVLLVVGGVLAACGGESQAAVRSAFVSRANQLCQKLTDDYVAAKAKLPTPPGNDDLVLLARATFVPDAIDTYQQIAALKMPKGDRQDLTSLMQQAIAEVQLIQADPLQGGSKGNQRDIVGRMRSYGLDQCGVGFDHDITHDEFVKEANSVCANLASKIGKLNEDQSLASLAPDARAAFVVNTAAPVYLDAVAQIEAIGYPPGDADVLKKLVADSRADIAAFTADPSLYFNRSRPAAVDIHQRWIAFGAVTCGDQPGG